MQSLRKLFAILIASSIPLWADDDFELPENLNFAPLEATSVSETPTAENVTEPADEPIAKIVSKKIPRELNRPVRIGVFTDEKELYVKQGANELTLTAKGNKLLISKGKSKPETVANKAFKQSGRCLSIAPQKKALAYNCYPGDFLITAKNGKLTAVNTVDIEEYLRGVIPYEIGKLDSSRFSALQAQAIAARTYTYKHLGSRESMGFDLFADTKDQVYKGLASATPLTDKAVKETAGIVMTYNGEFIIAYYHSTCGGETETLATWGRENLPYLQSRPDLRPDGTPWCNESSYTQWERKFSDSEASLLAKQNAKEVKSKLTQFTTVKEMNIVDTLPSGRILRMDVVTDKGTFSIAGDKVRWLLKKNGSILPSSFFRITHENGEWIITGKGFGHGVGMCQMGVRARAQAGQSFQEILTHYYPGITLEQFER